MLYDLIIIGGGPAGLTASIYANRAGLNAVIFEKLFVGGQVANTYEVENYPGFESISGPDLIAALDTHAKKFDSKVINEEVTGFDLRGPVKIVRTSHGEYMSNSIIITTGAKPKKLGALGEEKFAGCGVSYCATCDGAFFRGRSVAVVGGGNTAAEDALFLSRICDKVYVIHRRDTFRADKKLSDRLFNTPNVEVCVNSTVKEIRGESTVTGVTITNVNTNGEKTLDVSGVFIAVGVTPHSQLGEGLLELDENGYIITDTHMRTSVPGVFAAGDARNTVLRQIITAASDGAVAAYSAALYCLRLQNSEI